MMQMLIALAVLTAPQVVQPPATVDAALCTVDVEAQLSRTWQDYEFSTDTPGGPMWLGERGCYLAAARISRDYLARGPLLSVREQAITQLHMARNLAYAGDEVGAAQAAAQRSALGFKDRRRNSPGLEQLCPGSLCLPDQGQGVVGGQSGAVGVVRTARRCLQRPQPVRAVGLFRSQLYGCDDEPGVLA